MFGADDTLPEARQIQYEIWRAMPPGQKLLAACQMSDGIREFAAAGVRMRHPEYTERQVWLAVFRLTLGADLYAKAYPNEPIEL